MENYDLVEQEILSEILTHFIQNDGNFPEWEPFRLKHRKKITVVNTLKEKKFIWHDDHTQHRVIYLKLLGLLQIESDIAKKIVSNANSLIPVLQKMLDEDHSLLKKEVTLAELAERLSVDVYDLEISYYFLYEARYLGFNFCSGGNGKKNSQLRTSFRIENGVFEHNSIEEVLKAHEDEKKLSPQPIRGMNITDYFDTQRSTNYNLEQPPDFTKLTSDKKTQAILIRRWNECEKCVRGDIPLAATVMAGAFIETLLVVKWNLDSQLSLKDKPKNLEKFLEFAVKVKWIDEPTKSLGHVLREYRNFIHPEREIANDLELTGTHAITFWTVGKGFAHQILGRL